MDDYTLIGVVFVQEKFQAVSIKNLKFISNNNYDILTCGQS